MVKNLVFGLQPYQMSQQAMASVRTSTTQAIAQRLKYSTSNFESTVTSYLALGLTPKMEIL